MRICGVELTGSDAVICLLTQGEAGFNLPDCKVRKISLKKKVDFAERVKLLKNNEAQYRFYSLI